MAEFPDNLLDIQFKNDKACVLKKIGFTAKSARRQITDLPYSGTQRISDSKVEKAFLPPIITLFYIYIFEYTIIPDEKALATTYLNTYFERVSEKEARIKKAYSEKYDTSKVLSQEGLKGRILRAYPSLIRDFHFFLLCRDSGNFKEVKYSLKTDYFDGFDLIIVDKSDNEFFIKLYTETRRGTHYKNIKPTRRKNKNSTVKEISLGVNFSEKEKVGNFYLYDTDDLKKLESEINQCLKKK